MFTWIRDDPEALVVWVESGKKNALIEAEPEKFFTTAHYDDHPIRPVTLTEGRGKRPFVPPEDERHPQHAPPEVA